jgi:O-methyltransferase
VPPIFSLGLPRRWTRQLWKLRRTGVGAIRSRLLGRGLDLVPIMDRQTHLETIRRVFSESRLMMNGCEAYQILTTVKAVVEKVEGDLAEVGVFRGGSARLICETKGERPLHLFDTFAGLPEPGANDSGAVFFDGQFAATQAGVEAYLKGFPNLHFYPGLFPATAAPIADKRFCFVHLDVDLYEATRTGVEFFYPRLSAGGVLMSHDYDTPGVRRAVDEFFRDKREPVIQQPAGSHCLIVKSA